MAVLMTTYEKAFSILALLLLVGWMVLWMVDEELAARKEAHRWPYD